ncbi:DUF2975 domain-containing protein [Sphingomonas sp. M6A6_1c]|jgi:hypothetical protein
MQDKGLRIISGVLRFANGANWLAAIGFAAAVALSFVFGDVIAGHLSTKYPNGNVVGTIFILRIMAVLGIIAAVAVHQIFTRLLAMVCTVRTGDPFVALNADRLTRIGWALLTLQLLDLAMGLIVVALDRMGVDHATWTPAFTGWIAVIMVFALARVFRVGTAMRDDLALTV